jgi:hypothetical protein
MTPLRLLATELVRITVKSPTPYFVKRISVKEVSSLTAPGSHVNLIPTDRVGYSAVFALA